MGPVRHGVPHRQPDPLRLTDVAQAQSQEMPVGTKLELDVPNARTREEDLDHLVLPQPVGGARWRRRRRIPMERRIELHG